MNLEDYIGANVKYYDYLGLERFGRIVGFEPSNIGEGIYYVYIEDEDMDYNIHEDFVPYMGKSLIYAEIRLSNEICIDERKKDIRVELRRSNSL